MFTSGWLRGKTILRHVSCMFAKITSNLRPIHYEQLKSCANLFAILVNSRALIIDYMGYFLLAEQNNSLSFKLWFVLINLAVLLLSVLCLITFLLPPRFEVDEFKLNLVRHFVRLELILSILVIMIMASLWFSPIKLKLDEVEWKRSIAAYKYDQFKTDSNGYYPDGMLSLISFPFPATRVTLSVWVSKNWPRLIQFILERCFSRTGLRRLRASHWSYPTGAWLLWDYGSRRLETEQRTGSFSAQLL